MISLPGRANGMHAWRQTGLHPSQISGGLLLACALALGPRQINCWTVPMDDALAWPARENFLPAAVSSPESPMNWRLSRQNRSTTRDWLLGRKTTAPRLFFPRDEEYRGDHATRLLHHRQHHYSLATI